MNVTKVWQATQSALLLTITIRVVALIFGYSMQALPGSMEASHLYGSDMCENLLHWDPQLEQMIIEQGYHAESEPWPTTAKFPLFALISRTIMVLTGTSSGCALVASTSIGTFLCFLSVWLLVEFLRDQSTADRAIWHLACPLLGTGFVFIMSYPEGLYIALWAGTLLMFFKREDTWAGILLSLTVLARPHAIVLVPILALSIILQGIKATNPLDSWITRGLKVCALPSLVWTTWIVWTSWHTQIPWAPIEAQNYFGRETKMFPWDRIINRFEWMLFEQADFWWGGAFEAWHIILIGVSLFLIGSLVIQKQLPWEILAFTLISLVLPLSTNMFAIGRFAIATWIPIVLVDFVPEKYDRYITTIGFFLSILALVILGISSGSNWAGYIP